MKTIAFLSNKAGEGASVVYHLAWMLADQGVTVAAVDFDQQTNLTEMFFGVDGFEVPAPVEWVHERLCVLTQDLTLLWKGHSSHGDIREATDGRAVLALVDAGSSLDAASQTACKAADFVCFPLASDIHSRERIEAIGAALSEWKAKAQPSGYVVNRHQKWAEELPAAYRKSILREPAWQAPAVEADPHCLARLRHQRTLGPLAMDAHKPMFHLTPMDGALGAHLEAVRECHADYLALAGKIGSIAGIDPAYFRR